MKNCPGCGFPTRDDRMFCPVCDGSSPLPDVILEDGTRLYLKTNTTPAYGSLQMATYDKLLNNEWINTNRQFDKLLKELEKGK